VRTTLPFRDGEIEAVLEDETWTVRLGELEESARFLDFALSRLLDDEAEQVHRLAARIVEAMLDASESELDAGVQ
jgi:hypothetical protein